MFTSCSTNGSTNECALGGCAVQVQRFTRHSAVKNRKLLWHGTNIAVIVAILQGGLRIMPHSGGRLGRGLYFASENGKSAGYGTHHPLPVHIALCPPACAARFTCDCDCALHLHKSFDAPSRSRRHLLHLRLHVQCAVRAARASCSSMRSSSATSGRSRKTTAASSSRPADTTRSSDAVR